MSELPITDEDLRFIAGTDIPLNNKFDTKTITSGQLARYLLQSGKDIATLVSSLIEAQKALDFHQRAAKLMRKRKYFVVVAEDEPYYLEVYKMIRDHEIEIGRWNTLDEKCFHEALQEHLTGANSQEARS